MYFKSSYKELNTFVIIQVFWIY